MVENAEKYPVDDLIEAIKEQDKFRPGFLEYAIEITFRKYFENDVIPQIESKLKIKLIPKQKELLYDDSKLRLYKIISATRKTLYFMQEKVPLSEIMKFMDGQTESEVAAAFYETFKDKI